MEHLSTRNVNVKLVFQHNHPIQPSSECITSILNKFKIHNSQVCLHECGDIISFHHFCIIKMLKIYLAVSTTYVVS